MAQVEQPGPLTPGLHQLIDASVQQIAAAEQGREQRRRCLTPGSGYQPGNFQVSFSGPVSVAEALQRSLNVPAVDLLERADAALYQAKSQGRNRTLHATDNL